MPKKHSAESKSFVEPDAGGSLDESDRKKLELGEAMEHDHGQSREELEEDIEDIDKGKRD